MAALGQSIPSASPHVDFEELSLFVSAMGFEHERGMPRGEDVMLPGVGRESGFQSPAGLPALQLRLFEVTGGANCLEQLLLTTHTLPKGSYMIPFDIVVESASAEVA
jgi:hypothetical protein